MTCKSLIFFAVTLLGSQVFADGQVKSQHETNPVAQNQITNKGASNEMKTGYWGWGGGGIYGGGRENDWSFRWIHGGVYGEGHKCDFGCCSESFEWSRGSGGYFHCKCCDSETEAKAYVQITKAKSQTEN